MKALQKELLTKESKGRTSLKSFSIDVFDDFVTVNRAHRTNTDMVESKSIRVDRDVIVDIEKVGSNLAHVTCSWLWRDSTHFDSLTLSQATKLKLVIEQIANGKRNLIMQEKQIKGILIGNQIWSYSNLELDLGLQSMYPKHGEVDIRNIGRLYTYHGAQQIEETYKNWRIPSVEDYRELFSFFNDERLWFELTENLNFELAGFHSKKIDPKQYQKFMELNPALKINNGGFYWTSESFKKQLEGKNSLVRRYMYLNRYSKTPQFDETINNTESMFSLRLIKN